MENYSMWLIEYAYCPTQPVSSLVYSKHNQGTRTIPFTFMILKGNGHTIAIDTGYEDVGYAHELTEKFAVVGCQPIETVLNKIGISGKDVDTVILTHAHYDHMGGIKTFPNAHFYLQKKEFQDWLWAISQPKRYSFLTAAIDPLDIKNAIDLCAEGRMTLVDGEVKDLLPGISLVPVFDSHTYGLQLVVIENRDSAGNPDPWVFAGDSCYSFENLDGMKEDSVYLPVGFGVGSITQMIVALDKVREYSRNRKDRIILTHDTYMWENYPTMETPDKLHVGEIYLREGEPSCIK